MDFNKTIGSKLHGFVLKRLVKLDEISAELFEMEHEKTGARLVWINREDENKTFSIGFRTEPWDDTGVFHILEHSVLCGSKKFPVKEPFVELMKSSLNTFLNAMTFSEKTAYPVCSRNNQDFINLMRVYLDAVFHPNVVENENIFRQEGWHYEITDEGKLIRNGVVYNEMKGAFSDADRLLFTAMTRSLFPDTCYGLVSGGDPVHIPELTYEAFVDAHKRLYNPSNSYIFLDGKMDIDQILGIIEDEYLCEFERREPSRSIGLQKPVDGGVTEIEFELNKSEELTKKHRIAWAFVKGQYEDQIQNAVLHLVGDVLCGDNSSPLKKAVLETGLAGDISFSAYSSRQTMVYIVAKDMKAEDSEAVEKAVFDAIREQCDTGMDHARIHALLDNYEFSDRERDYGRTPTGLVFGIKVFGNMVFDVKPENDIEIGTIYDELRALCDNGGFEKILREAVLENGHKCKLFAHPSHTLGEEKAAADEKKLQEIFDAMSAEEKQQIREAQEKLKAWQSKGDSPEELAKIPSLKLSDINPEIEHLPMEVRNISGIETWQRVLPTSGITHYHLDFNTTDFREEELPLLTILSKIVCSLDTEKTSMEELGTLKKSVFGNHGIAVNANSEKYRLDRYKLEMSCSASVLDSKLEKSLELFLEMLTTTRFDDKEKIRTIVRQEKNITGYFTSSGHILGMQRAGAAFDASSAAQGPLFFYEYYQFIKELDEHFDERFEELSRTLQQMAKKIFVQKRLIVKAGATEASKIEKISEFFAKNLPVGEYEVPAEMPVKVKGITKEAIVTASDVSYAALACNHPAFNTGLSTVCEKHVSLNYLWNAVRVQGGAYGVGARGVDPGTLRFYSYRDPQPGNSLNCYRMAPAKLEELDNVDISKVILGCIGDSDPLLSTTTRIFYAFSRYDSGIGEKEIEQQRREMLEVTAEDIKAQRAYYEENLKNSSICVVGNAKHIEACKDEFDRIIEL